MSTNHPMQIAIVGAGIGGLAAACYLLRDGHDVRVYERAPVLAEVGAGLVLAPNAMRLLSRLGLRAEVERTAEKLEAGWEFRRWDRGDVLSVQPLGEVCEQRFGEATWTIHRADLHDMLRALVPSGRLHLGCEAAGIEQDDDSATIIMTDGSRVNADLVIAADGINSALRRAAVEVSEPVFSGLTAWRALVPMALAPELAHRPVQSLWLGPKRHVVHYPISAGTKVNIVAVTPSGENDIESWDAVGHRDDLVREFDGWAEPLMDLLSGVEQVGRWALVDRPDSTGRCNTGLLNQQ